MAPTFDQTTLNPPYLSFNADEHKRAFENSSRHHSRHMVWSQRGVMCLLYTITLTGIETIEVIYVLDKQEVKKKKEPEINAPCFLSVYCSLVSFEFGI